MNNITTGSSDSFREKGSKFIGFLFPVDSKEAFEAELAGLKSEYPDATHHCYAWRIHPANVKEFSQDDGEPGGSAGLPILNQLKSFEAVNAGLVVVRYYGGTNLGKSGLIEAYGRSAKHCLQKAELKPINLIWRVEIKYPYPQQNTVEKLIHQFDLEELESSYLEEVAITFACPVKYKPMFMNALEQLKHKGIEYRFLDKSFI